MDPMGEVAVIPNCLKGCIVEEVGTGTHDGSFWVEARFVLGFSHNTNRRSYQGQSGPSQ